MRRGTIILIIRAKMDLQRDLLREAVKAQDEKRSNDLFDQADKNGEEAAELRQRLQDGDYDD